MFDGAELLRRDLLAGGVLPAIELRSDGATVWLNGLAFGLVLMSIPDKTGTWAEHFLPHASLTKFVGPKSNVTILLAGEGWDTARGATLAWSSDPSSA
jgi:hypothetical protein